jgi:hypothetical protein
MADRSGAHAGSVSFHSHCSSRLAGHVELFAVHRGCGCAQNKDRHVRVQCRQHACQRHPHQRQVLHHHHFGPAQRCAEPAAHGGRRADHGIGARLRLWHRAAVLADSSATAVVRLLPVPADGSQLRELARGSPGCGQVPREGLRRRAAADQVHRCRRLRGRQGGDRRGDRLPPQSRAVPAGRCRGAARGTDGRPAGDRQDAARPRGSRGGLGTVFLCHRVQLPPMST